MKNVGRPLALLLSIAVAAAFEAESADGGTFHLNGRDFNVPDGFKIEMIAGTPLVDRPIVADFDEQGRLYVADSSGSNDKVENQVVERTHRVVRLEDTNGDGVFDRSTVFADKMMFPEGAMFFDGSLYVSAPPSIWKLTDTNDDGIADRREEWYQGKTLTGCANDLHGPYAGLDGWIYWCKGAFAEQTHERPGKSPLVSRAAHIFRCRPDGSGLEPVMTGGMDNPVEVVFTPSGERIFTTTFFQHPGGGRRDGLVHAIYGGVYGKVHGVIEGHPRTGPDVMPVLTHLGPAAPSGLAVVESSITNTDSPVGLLACNFNLRKVTRHVLEPVGATFKTVDSDFLTSTHQDFHPTDVLEDADGSIVVVDTGGWYKLCCPTSQLEKPDVLGAIYRIKPDQTPTPNDPRGLQRNWEALRPDALAAMLKSTQPAIRKRAISRLARLKNDALPALRKRLEGPEADGLSKLNAVWTATRIGSEQARAFVRDALKDSNESVVQAAAHSASLWKDRMALEPLVSLLKPSHASATKRVAAEALGRLGLKEAIAPLIEAASAVEPTDRVLQHSLTYALIEIGDPVITAKGLNHPSPPARRAALIAIDQMEGDKLEPDQVALDLASDDPATRETATWIVGRHADWGTALAGFFKARLAKADLSKTDRDELASQLGKFVENPEIQTLMLETLGDPNISIESRAVVLQGIAASKLQDAPRPILEAILKALRSNSAILVEEGVRAARSIPPAENDKPSYRETLLKVAANSQVVDAVRLESLLAMPGGLDATADPALFAFLLSKIGPDEPAGQRSSAATILSTAKLNADQLTAVAALIPNAGPLELDKLLTAFEQSNDPAIGKTLVTTLNNAGGLGSLRVDRLKTHLAPYGEAIKEQAEALYAKLNLDAGKQKAYLEALLPDVGKGDIRRGQTVFNGVKASCRTCHAIGYVGGNAGPDLSRVGGIRSDRDLLEAIVYPSVSFVRSYEPITIALKNGKVVNGILRNETSDELLLIIGANEEARIPRDEIEEMRPGTVSVMPAGLDQQLTREELIDLVAFLKSRQ